MIPKLLHQIWKTDQIPPRFSGFRETWLEHHADWEYKLWTDEDVLQFVRDAYPEFLPVFQGYARPICRVDAGRYLILKHFGGLYVDLDFECFRPLDDLIASFPLSIGLEPASHLKLEAARQRELEHILCPSLIASVPDHPFWGEVVSRLYQNRDKPDPLDATGPFLLTGAFEAFAARGSINLLAPETVYPADKFDCWEGRLFDIAYWERITRKAYALHHWDGGWFRGGKAGRDGVPRKLQMSISVPKDRAVAEPAPEHDGLPLVSCLMTTRNRFDQALLAIDCFRRQTYANRELIIVDDSADDRLSAAVADNPQIRLIRPNDPEPVLGRARNRAVEAAAGTYVCQWDDDDLFDPLRIQIQMAALRKGKARACVLSRFLMWWPELQRIAVSPRRPWEGSLLCEKSALPSYPELNRGEDTPAVADLLKAARVAHLDAPRLYLYVAHGRNTWPTSHFEAHWAGSEHRFTDERYRAVATELGKRVPLLAYKQLLAGAPSAKDKPSIHAPAKNEARTDHGRGKRPLAKDIRIRRGKGSLLSWAAENPDSLPGINLYGHMEAPTGLGAAARSLAGTLTAAGIPHTVIDLDSSSEQAARPDHPINIVHTNPDALLNNRFWSPKGALSAEALSDRYNIGYWAWESATTFPERWRRAFRLFDEIWAPSQFTAQCLRPVSPVMVTVVAHAVDVDGPALGRDALRLPNGRYLFAFVFDELSGFERKNPVGLVRAFRRAFPDGEADLIIKARSLSAERRSRLEAEADGCPSIIFRVGEEGRDATLGLIGACDAYVSLHRAEGFGLTVAEAMALSKPVVATDYSGVVDFFTPDTGFPVRYSLTELNQAAGYYPKGTVWAEPDIEHAASLMREVHDDRSRAQAVSRRAAEHIRSTLNAAAVGARIRDRLTSIVEQVTQEAAPSVSRSSGRSVARSPAELPTVLILTPVKDAEPHLPGYFRALNRLDYPRDKLSLAFLEGDSVDGSLAYLEERLPELQTTFGRAALFRKDFGVRLNGPRWTPALQKLRRGTIAKARNWLLSAALRDEEWVLWIDADVIDYPQDVLRRLLAAGRDIIVPHCVHDHGGPTFDLNTFQVTPQGTGLEQQHMVDGLYQPPRGVGRRYLEDLRGQKLVEVDSVGGTMLLLRSDLHRQGLIFPPVSFRGYIETEGLAMMAKDMGESCWGVPDLEVIHARV